MRVDDANRSGRMGGQGSEEAASSRDFDYSRRQTPQ
jgi:hypothetical protein